MTELERMLVAFSHLFGSPTLAGHGVSVVARDPAKAHLTPVVEALIDHHLATAEGRALYETALRQAWAETPANPVPAAEVVGLSDQPLLPEKP